MKPRAWEKFLDFGEVKHWEMENITHTIASCHCQGKCIKKGETGRACRMCEDTFIDRAERCWEEKRRWEDTITIGVREQVVKKCQSQNRQMAFVMYQ